MREGQVGFPVCQERPAPPQAAVSPASGCCPPLRLLSPPLRLLSPTPGCCPPPHPGCCPPPRLLSPHPQAAVSVPPQPRRLLKHPENSENNLILSELCLFFPSTSFVLFLTIYPLMITLKLQLAAIWLGLVLVEQTLRENGHF